jgi:peroxiredoxin Q/BCP
MKPGEHAPDFELPDENGQPRRLSDMLVNGPVVLFWYPFAMTTGCTKEACHFRDLSAEFAKLGAQRVGISMDDVAKQKQFSAKEGLDYPLLADPEGTVSKQYGVKRSGLMSKLGPAKRMTFVIGPDQKILDVITGELKFQDHADKALAALAR